VGRQLNPEKQESDGERSVKRREETHAIVKGVPAGDTAKGAFCR
jgi:hypothetical protein